METKEYVCTGKGLGSVRTHDLLLRNDHHGLSALITLSEHSFHAVHWIKALYCIHRMCWLIWDELTMVRVKRCPATGHHLFSSKIKYKKCQTTHMLPWLLLPKRGFDKRVINRYRKPVYIKLIKGKALRKHSLHEKTAASVLLKLFISSNEWCHTTDAT